MKGARMHVAFCLAVLSIPEARALRVEVYPVTPLQVEQTDKVRVGLAVQGWTNVFALTVAGGYTVTCPNGLPIEAQHSRQRQQFPAGFTFTITVPAGGTPTQYPIPGWSSWPRPSTHDCTFRYVGRAKEALVSLIGFGFNVSLGGGDDSKGDTLVFKMVKPRLVERPPPCTPGFNCCIP